MVRKTASKAPAATAEEADLRSLYYDFLDRFYGKNGKDTAKFAALLETALDGTPDAVDSILAAEIRSLLAEFKEDFEEAVRWRETEIRKIFELHSMSVNTPSWEFVTKFYDYSDLADRLILLSMLYDKLGELDHAISILEECKDYCSAHKTRFEADDLYEELTEAKAAETRKAKGGKPNGAKRRHAPREMTAGRVTTGRRSSGRAVAPRRRRTS